LTVDVALPADVVAESRKYRSENDFESKRSRRFQLIDTPGHAKLRRFAYEALGTRTANLTGVIFVVDAADLTSSSGDGSSNGLRESASYLYDVLLELQRQYTTAKKSKVKELPLLIAANKMDLFTSLPEHMVKSSLEAEITRLRTTRSKGIASVGRANKGEGLESSIGDEENDEEGEILGGDPNSKFDFSVMGDYGVNVSLKGGSVLGDTSVSDWWEWIASCL
jgi:signal recognition particle receptor subunit beta